MLILVLDTNVVVSALLKPESLPALILSLILQNNCRLCLSKEIYTEYKEVLARDKFKDLDQAGVSKLLATLRKHSLWVEPKPAKDNPVKDAADKMFIECALSAKAAFIVTGNKKHFPGEKVKGTKIVTPREFIDQLMIVENT